MKHFTISELTKSVTAQKHNIDNTPSPEHLANIYLTVAQLLDPLRDAWAVHCANNQLGTPALRVSSGYRGFRLNSKIKGSSSTSAHCYGYAFDLVPMNGRLAEFKAFCRGYLKGKAFDQMISEAENAQGVPQWIHLGYKNRLGGQRRQFKSKVGNRYIPMT